VEIYIIVWKKMYHSKQRINQQTAF